MKPAGHTYTRKELVSLKRADIQKLCKDYGVRANMKTDALVELLLDSIHSNMSPLVPPQPQPQPVPTRRVSTRSSSRASTLRSRGASGSSAATSQHPIEDRAQKFPVANINAVTISRTSKSRETQSRLGVGRPIVAGGLCVRSITRSSSAAKLKRGGNSRSSLRPPEATIDEEFEIPQSEQHGPQWSSPSSTQNDDVVARLGRLESILRDADIKQQFNSLKDVPSQLSSLKASVLQRETEVANLRGELNVCKMEMIALRGEVSKIPLLEDQLRIIKENLDQLGVATSSAITKGKMVARRVSVPLGESKINSVSSSRTLSVPNTQPTSQPEQTNPLSESAATALGKRVRDAKEGNTIGAIDAREGKEMVEMNFARRPDRKRAKNGTERRPLQEKEIVPRIEYERPHPDQESGEESATSSGISSGPSSVPSVSTPAPTTHLPEYLDQSFDTEQNVHAGEGVFNFSFRQAASSTPRDDVFGFLDDEPFSPGSAMKASHPTALDNADSSGVQPSPFEVRRISNAAARPHTPTRSSGPNRFRIDVTHVSPVKDIGSPFDPYDNDPFGLPLGVGPSNTGNVLRREAQGHGQGHRYIPASMPIALGFGLGTAAPGVLLDDTPVRPASRTMYGTELTNDTRFGDFGRDGIASTSNMNFWGPL